MNVKEVGAEVVDVGGLKLEEGGRHEEWGRCAGGARRWAAGLSVGLDAEMSGGLAGAFGQLPGGGRAHDPKVPGLSPFFWLHFIYIYSVYWD